MIRKERHGSGERDRWTQSQREEREREREREREHKNTIMKSAPCCNEQHGEQLTKKKRNLLCLYGLMLNACVGGWVSVSRYVCVCVLVCVCEREREIRAHSFIFWVVFLSFNFPVEPELLKHSTSTTRSLNQTRT